MISKWKKGIGITIEEKFSDTAIMNQLEITWEWILVGIDTTGTNPDFKLKKLEKNNKNL
jgi:hypothetical protein